jgi:hypothetical protein
MFRIYFANVMRFYYMLCERIVLVPANKAHGEVQLKHKKLLTSTLYVLCEFLSRFVYRRNPVLNSEYGAVWATGQILGREKY